MVTTCEMITSAQQQHLYSEQEIDIFQDFVLISWLFKSPGKKMYDLTSSRLHPPPWPWLWLCKSVSSTGPLGLVSPASILVPELG